MGCGEFLVKYILFFANLFFALAGLALIGLGVAVELQVSEIVKIVEASSFQVAPITAIVLGTVIFLIAFFGCCGAIKENNCMLITYSIFMLILMLAKVTLAVLIFVNLDGYVKEIPRWLNDAFNRNQVAFQDIERTFKCCGPTGPLSYGNVVLPETCCSSTPCTPLNAYGGCSKVVEEFFETFGVAIGGLAIAVVAIELVAVVFGLCLANHVRNQSRRARTAIAIAGGLLLYQLRNNPPLDINNYNLAVILVIVLGCVVVLISALGWCGSCAEKKVLLYIYSGLILIIAGLQIYAVVKIRSADTINEEAILKSLEETFNNSSQLPTFHAMEIALQCCGPDGPDSYAGLYDFLPRSCCANVTDISAIDKPGIADQVDLMALTCSVDDAHPGCKEVLVNFLKMVTHYLGLAFIIAISVELLAPVMALSLSCCIGPRSV
ncbi:unnamed protein product [Leptosia nina]|uniref:Tetraspanin n=1 Tax=Leptosia nina TaxID=320188 RepID=A0AAV1J1A2_9NEOP